MEDRPSRPAPPSAEPARHPVHATGSGTAAAHGTSGRATAGAAAGDATADHAWQALQGFIEVAGYAVLRRAAGRQEVLRAACVPPELRPALPSWGWPDSRAAGHGDTVCRAASGGHVVEVTIRGDGDVSFVVLLIRSDPAHPFREDEIETIARLAPVLAHLARSDSRRQADQTAARAEETVRCAALAVLDQFAVGLCLVDAELRVAFLSGTAARSGALPVRQGRLGICSAEDLHALRAAVAAVLSGAGGLAQGVCLTAPDGPLRALVTAVQLPLSHAGGMPERLAAIILPPLSAPDHQDRVIQGMFGLTRVEAAITKLLSDGVPPNDAAEKLRLRPNTLRGYMKSIFAKLGVHRQSELVRLVSTTAGLVRGGGDPTGQSRPQPEGGGGAATTIAEQAEPPPPPEGRAPAMLAASWPEARPDADRGQT